jgi:hypothetical protein
VVCRQSSFPHLTHVNLLKGNHTAKGLQLRARTNTKRSEMRCINTKILHRCQDCACRTVLAPVILCAGYICNVFRFKSTSSTDMKTSTHLPWWNIWIFQLKHSAACVMLKNLTVKYTHTPYYCKALTREAVVQRKWPDMQFSFPNNASTCSFK